MENEPTHNTIERKKIRIKDNGETGGNIYRVLGEVMVSNICFCKTTNKRQKLGRRDEYVIQRKEMHMDKPVKMLDCSNKEM